MLLCLLYMIVYHCSVVFFFQAEDGIRDLVRSRGLGDVYKRQLLGFKRLEGRLVLDRLAAAHGDPQFDLGVGLSCCCLLYTSDAADERSSVDLGGRRIIKKKKTELNTGRSRT